jgi:hypothetical protein
MEPPLLAVGISILEKVRRATSAGLVEWSRAEDPDEFIGRAGEHTFLIKFKYPAYNADEASDRDYVEVHVFRSGHRFMVGTTGWYLTLEILAAGIPEYKEHLAKVLESARQTEAALDDLLG